jgi:phage-related holin
MKTFLYKYASKLFLIALAYLSPIAPLLIATILFCILDFITGIFKAYKLKTVNSKKMQHKAWDMFFYLAAIILSFVFYNLFKDYIDFPLHKVTAFIILSIEFWSNMENISTITGIPLLTKDKFAETVEKLKDIGKNTAKKDTTNEN